MNFNKTIIKLFSRIFAGQVSAQPNPTPTPNPTPVAPPPPPPPPVVEIPKNIVDPIPIDEIVMAQKVYLGYCDQAASDEQIKALMKVYNRNMWDISESIKYSQFRHGDLFKWIKIKRIEGQPVKTLQTFLVNAGIMPANSNRDGVFAYGTQAGVRLFQEYVRIYEDQPDMIPTGIVDERTWKLMQDWQKKEKKADHWKRGEQNPEFKKWLTILTRAKDQYIAHGHEILEMVAAKANEINQKIKPAQVDTIPFADWNLDPDEVHLIGIRIKQEAAGSSRKNDDAFILLINGMVFKFWGSTDPKATSERADEAFLTEGQHKFRFGWHNISEKRKEKAYQALNPFDKGVLVFRDRDNDDKLTEKDIKKGVDSTPNTTINIHWTGFGDRSTWSSGCQVIAGESYVDNLGVERNCSAFAARDYDKDRSNKEDNIKKTKGAYNVFTDLLLLYAPKNQDYLFYTLGQDETLTKDFLSELDGMTLLTSTLDSLNMPTDPNLRT